MTNGPKVEIKLSCFNCQFKRGESDRCQGDSGWSYFCEHPAIGGDYIGVSAKTPEWCPLREAAIAAKIGEVVGLPSDDELFQIDKRVAAATEGPWVQDYQPEGPCGSRCYRDQIQGANRSVVVARPHPALSGPAKAARHQEIADGQFIAAARSDVPMLVAAIRRVKRSLKTALRQH